MAERDGKWSERKVREAMADGNVGGSDGRRDREGNGVNHGARSEGGSG